jgi:hypothetical protein
VKTRFASKVIMFEETFQFKNAIILCYGKQNYFFFQQKIPKAQVWAIVEVIASTLHLVVLSHCGMNRSRGTKVWTILRHWCLQVESMDQIIMVKNSPNDLCANCKPNSNFKQYLKIEESLALKEL